mgnify:CR=1 FL=1
MGLSVKLQRSYKSKMLNVRLEYLSLLLRNDAPGVGTIYVYKIVNPSSKELSIIKNILGDQYVENERHEPLYQSSTWAGYTAQLTYRPRFSLIPAVVI